MSTAQQHSAAAQHSTTQAQCSTQQHTEYYAASKQGTYCFPNATIHRTMITAQWHSMCNTSSLKALTNNTGLQSLHLNLYPTDPSILPSSPTPPPSSHPRLTMTPTYQLLCLRCQAQQVQPGSSQVAMFKYYTMTSVLDFVSQIQPLQMQDSHSRM